MYRRAFAHISSFTPLVVNRVSTRVPCKFLSLHSLVAARCRPKIPSFLQPLIEENDSCGFVVELGMSVEILVRVLQLSCIFAAFVPAGIFVVLSRLVVPRRLYGRFFPFFIKSIISAFSVLGPTWIKLGQWASTRPDLLSPELIEGFKIFHHHSPTHSTEETMFVLERSFGKKMDDMFSSFDPQPCGSGSIAQVHRAVLKANGRPVAVKICHPNVHRYLNVDFALLSLVVGLVPALKWVGIKEEIAHLSASFKRQADLREEAMNLKRFHAHFRGCEDRIGFPIPIYPFVCRDVLVESLEVGLTLDTLFQASDVISKRQPVTNTAEVLKQINDQVVSTIFAVFLKMILLDNFSHADLHPGNMLIQLREYRQVDSKRRQQQTENAVLKLKKKILKFRAYLWPISSFRAAVALNDIDVEQLGVGDKLSFLLPHAKVFSLLDASPWLSEYSPLSAFSFSVLPIRDQHAIISALSGLGNKNEDIAPGEKKNIGVRVVFLDAGLVTSLDTTRFINFLDLFKTLVLWRDGYKAGRLIIERHPLNQLGGVIDEEDFCRKTQFMVQNFFSSHPPPIRSSGDGKNGMPTILTPLPLGAYHIGPILQNLLQLVRDHHVRLDDQYANLVMSIVFVEGLGRRLCPTLDLLPFLKQAALHYFFKT